MPYTIELAHRLRRRLFKQPVVREFKTRYDPLDDASEIKARDLWAVHGVCLECRCRAVTCGRCVDCGVDYAPEVPVNSVSAEMLVRTQLQQAVALV